MGWIDGLLALSKIAASKIMKTFGVNHTLSKDGKTLKVNTPKSRKNVNFVKNITPFETAMVARGLQDPDGAIKTEPPNIVLESKRSLPPITNPYDDIKAHRDIAYYPAGKNPHGRGDEGKKPNIEAIRQWVENTKIGNASHITISENFGKEYGFVGWGFSDKEKENAINEVAFLVARKIWYVGRKPDYMIDEDWQKETKHMRPAEGSFSANEKWANGFPYGETYKYESGKIKGRK
jgi:hypothetical protein